MGLSIRAYAKVRGVSHVAVLKAIKAGRIPIEPDGAIDPGKADAAWERSTDPGRTKSRTKAKPSPEALKPVADAAVGSVRETLKEQGLPPGGPWRKIRRGARLWTVAVATFKSETYRYLRLVAPTDEDIAAGATVPPGFIHLPQGAEAEWIKQLVAEQLVTR